MKSGKAGFSLRIINEPMKIEIWSDVVCPFCYIGKRKFEKALEEFGDQVPVKITWRSFQLDPDLVPEEGMSIHTYLAKRKGVPVEKGKAMNDYMSGLAKEAGLDYHFDKTVVTNTMDAHRLLHFAKTKGLQNETKENLFKAYYTEGKNLNSLDVLTQIAVDSGLDGEAVIEVLQGTDYRNDVLLDQLQAQKNGVQGVPFFVFNNQYAVSGAQPTAAFLQVLQQIAGEELLELKEAENAVSCGPDGICL